MFYVYLITDSKEFYVGFTTDLKKRIAEHNAGKNFSTQSVLPWQLLFYEAHTNEADARRRERYLKTTKGRRALKKMTTKARSDTKIFS